jgi:C1A family cysteine protease
MKRILRIAKRVLVTAALALALICALFSYGGAFGSAHAADPVTITPPEYVTFINVPDSAFQDKINNEEYYRKLFGDGTSSNKKSLGISTQALSWSSLRAFNWRTDWNDASRLDQRPKSSPVFQTRDQGAFGSCWAFAALASAQGSLVVNGLAASSPSSYLSPYHLVFSAYNKYTFGVDIRANNSNMNTLAKAALNGGGNADMAGSAMSKWFGPAPESRYKYPTNSKPDAITSLPQLQQSSYHMQYALNFPNPNDKKSGVVSGKGAASIVPSQLNAIKSALYTYGPLATSYYANGTYRQTGTFYAGQANGSTTYYQTAHSYADHGVTLVGWNDDVPASAFDNGSGIRPKGNGAFLIQNSWGESWADGGGFFWLSYYDPSMGTSTYLSLDNTANSDNIYYWDDLGYAGADFYNLSWYAGKQVSYMSNVFKAGAQTKVSAIEAAGVYASSPGTTFEVSVYRNPPNGNPSGGTALAIGEKGSKVISSTAKFAGYHTIFFANPQQLEQGDTFSVVVKVLNNNSDDSSLTCEGVLYDYGSDADHVTISAGQSYYSKDGKAWTDLASTYASAGSGLGNFNIRAYTTGVEIKSIGISPSYPIQKTYKVGEEFNYKVGKIQINYANGTQSYVSLINNNVKISGFDTRATWMKNVTISFMGKTLTYQISVVTWTWANGLNGISGAPAVYKYASGAKANYINVSSAVSPSNSSDKKIIWSVAGPASIASTGISTARITFTGKEGDVTVTASPNDAKNIKKTAHILVAANVTSIKSPIKTVYLKKNSTYTLPCVAYDGNIAAQTSLTFASNNRALKIGANGKVRAGSVKKKTKAKVTVGAKSGYKKVFNLVIVPKAAKLKTIALKGAPSKMKRGKYKQISLKLNPTSATNITPKFTSSNSKVLSVDKTGRIFAKKKGKAKITVRAGGKKAVTKYIKVT